MPFGLFGVGGREGSHREEKAQKETHSCQKCITVPRRPLL